MRKYKIILVLLFFASSISAQDTDARFKSANEAYQQKEFNRAVELYSGLAGEGITSAELYFNLGNAFFKSNQIASAIINYERALLLSPDDEDIRFNLKLANLRIVDKIEPVPELFILKWMKNLINGRTADSWAKVAVFFLWIAFLFGCAFVFVGSAGLKRITFFVGVVFVVLAIVALIFGVRKNRIDTLHPYAIVFAQNSYVKSAPDNQSTDLFILHEGVKVQLVEATHEWSKIKLADGKVGWIRSLDMEKI